MVNRRLPMPGEKPSSVWKPRFYRPLPRRLPSIRIPAITLRRGIALLIVAGLLIGARQIWLNTATRVTVLVNGQPVSVVTHRGTVGGAVQVAGVRLDDTVYVEPPAETPLKD